MFQMVADAPSENRVEMLRGFAQRHSAIYGAIQLALDPRIQWDFTPGWVPEYKPTDYFDQEGNLHQEMRKMSKFLVGGPYPQITEERRRELFIQLLESVAPADAELLVLAKDKKLPPKITRKLIDEAFPGLLIPEEKPEEKPKKAEKKADKKEDTEVSAEGARD